MKKHDTKAGKNPQGQNRPLLRKSCQLEGTPTQGTLKATEGQFVKNIQQPQRRCSGQELAGVAGGEAKKHQRGKREGDKKSPSGEKV